MKILIFGASGKIGNAVFQHLSNQYDVYGTYCKNKPNNIDDNKLRKYDIADYNHLYNMLNNDKPDLIISSLTGDFDNQLKTHECIAKYLYETSGRCIFISSANVFDGSPIISHNESETPYSISQYGKYKYSCEQMLLKSLERNCLIIRLPRTLSCEDIKKELQQIKNGKQVFSNLFMSYTSVNNVTNAVMYCININKSGIVHLSSNDFVSNDKFVKLLLSHTNEDISYVSATLTIEHYCNLLGCDNPALLHKNIDGIFNLSLNSVDIEISSKFDISCDTVISSLVNDIFL